MGQPIKRLTVKGFKSIRSLEDLELGDLTILIGANGAGKSNFVSVFSLLRSMVDGRFELAVNHAGGADKLLYLGPKVTNKLELKLYFGANGYEPTLRFTKDNRLIFDDEIVFFDGDLAPIRRSLGSGHRESKLRKINTLGERHVAGAICSYVHTSVSSWIDYHFHDTSDYSAVRLAHTTRDYEKLRHNASNLAAFLLHLRECRIEYYELVRNTVQLVAPFFDDFVLRRHVMNDGDTEVLLEWNQKGSDYPFHPSQFSDGTLRFVGLATALLQPDPPSTMLLDEPELGMHPYALEMLSGLIHQAATRTQVIVSTQSTALVDHAEPEQVVVVERDGQESKFTRLDRARLRDWLKEYTLGELWEKNVIGGRPNG